MFFLDLYLADITRMLNDFGDVCFMSATDLASDAFSQVRESTIHPVFPEDTDAVAEWRKVGFDHAEGAMDGPEDEEDNEEVVHVPEALKVCAPCLFHCREHHGHQRNQHDVSTPSGTRSKVGENEAHES